MEQDTELMCTFTNCSKGNEEIKQLSQVRLDSIARARKEHRDNFWEIVDRLKTDGVVSASQRSFISTCMSVSYVATYLKQKRKNEEQHNPESKRLRRSDKLQFNFRKKIFVLWQGISGKDEKTQMFGKSTIP